MTDENLIMVKFRLVEAMNNFRQNYSYNPLHFYQHLVNCMCREKQLLGNQEEICRNMDMNSLSQKIQEIVSQVQSMDHHARNLCYQYEEVIIAEQELKKVDLKADLENSQLNLQELKLQQSYGMQRRKNQIKEFLEKLAANYHKILHFFETVKIKVFEKYLDQWKKNQFLREKDKTLPKFDYLDTIQGWCENLVDILWKIRGQISNILNLERQLQSGFDIEVLTRLVNAIEKELVFVVQKCFIIEKQPPRIIKKETRICPSVTVRFLFGNIFNMKMMGPTVKASIVSETLAQQIYRTGQVIEQFSGNLLNNVVTLDYDDSNKHLSAQFRSLQIKDIKHTNKKGTENVTDEKFSFVFQCNFTVGSDSLLFTALDMSYPFVVIVNVNQKDKAAATIFWDNSFGEYNRVPFFAPDQVSWEALSEALKKYFLSTTCRELSQENLHFLAEKIFKNEIPKIQKLSDFQITKNQFCKDLLPDRTFSFWKWFYAAAELIRDHLKGPWMDGSIVGFIDKTTSEQFLMQNCVPGTFLLRFSDSEPGDD